MLIGLCIMYSAIGVPTTIPALRWGLFRLQNLEGKKLSCTRATVRPINMPTLFLGTKVINLTTLVSEECVSPQTSNIHCLRAYSHQRRAFFSAAEILLRMYQNPIHLNGTRCRTRFWRQREVRRRKNVVRQRAPFKCMGF